MTGLTVYPYLRPPGAEPPTAPSRLYRFDLRAPDAALTNSGAVAGVQAADLLSIFDGGFRAFGTWYDLDLHVAAPPASWFNAGDGFVSLAEDVGTAIPLFARWRGATGDGDGSATLAQRLTRLLTQQRSWRDLSPAKQVETDTQLALVAQAEKTAGWLTGWLYTIRPSRFMVHVASNLLDARQRQGTPDARRAAAVGGEWVAPCRVPPAAVLEAVRIEVTVTAGRNAGDGRPVRTVQARVGDQVRTNPKRSDDDYDPFTRRAESRWDGLISYQAPPGDPRLPGHVDFPVAQLSGTWQGAAEYWKADGSRREPSHAKEGIPLTTPQKGTTTGG
ncbi:hypothetical protein [Streptomyces hainanensis]|uniref:Uncharacterized protein n=1 Tax=Streptomyces hainanensis TaxID=402648 RepID=A0A4R4TQX2_9ACTN|nr:hypothetical protein [Streptomyces hainanensis]TDC78374.1 hypothetical protein E1283_05240 [Streptomyces hainanensis]